MIGAIVSAVSSSNLISIAIVGLTSALAGLWIWSQTKPRKDFPPGPRGWPLIGNLLDFAHDKQAHEVIQGYADQYGNVFSLRLGTTWTVVLNGAPTIKEALIKNAAAFANRPNSITMEVSTEGRRSISSGQFTSPAWTLHRKLVHSAIRTLATGKNDRFENLVYSIVPGLSQSLNEKGSNSFDIKPLLSSSVYNILATMCFGKQYDYDGAEIKQFMKITEDVLDVLGTGVVADFIPIFRYIPTKGLRQSKRVATNFIEFMDREVQEHLSSYQGGEPKDLLEMLLHHKKEMEDEGKEDMSVITEAHIRQTVGDVFGAGTNTTVMTLHWCVMLLCQYGDAQEKVFEEVDRVVGRERFPKLEDRINLPYTSAALCEVMRFSSILPLSVPHATSKEVKLDGYTLPEGTWVLVNLFSMHYDDTLWNEPRIFRPEHFLDEAGKVRVHPEGFLPFSTGRRVCVGESLAKAELFLFFSWLFHHYKFAKAPNMENKDYSEFNAIGTFILPQNYEVVVERRF